MYDILIKSYNSKDYTMNNLQNHIEIYLEYCSTQKRLNRKTLKAYRIDLQQFSEQISVTKASELTAAILETYVAKLHQQYAPKTVKRKFASLKVLFHYFEYKEIINQNPFSKLQINFREPIVLPTIPLHTIIIRFRSSIKISLKQKDQTQESISSLVFENIQILS